MTMREKLEKELKELAEKCEAQRCIIEKNFNNTYEDVLDLNTNRSRYLVSEIKLLNFDKEFITFIVEFEDGQDSYLRITPDKIGLTVK